MLASRQRTDQADVLRVLVRNGARYWSTAAPSARSLVRFENITVIVDAPVNFLP